MGRIAAGESGGTGILGYRHLLLALLFLCTFTAYVLRVNINIAILDMMDVPADVCQNNTNAEHVFYKGRTRFCWSDTEKGWILGAFFYGYIIPMIPGGALSERIGSKMVLGISLLLTSILGMLTPEAARWGAWSLFALRVLQGLVSGVTYPSLPPIVKRWSLASELSSFIAVSYVGGTFGTCVTYPIGGIILQHWGWEAVFYVSGALGVAWFVLWMIFASNDPMQNRFISGGESKRILMERKEFSESKTSLFPPMHKIAAIPTVWITAISDFGQSVATYFIITEGPTFIQNILHQDITTNGFLSMLPSLSSFLYSQLFGFTSDYIGRKGWLSKSSSILLFEGISMVIPGIGCLMLTFFTDKFIPVMFTLVVVLGTRAGIYAGRYRVPYEILPDYAGPTFGLMNMIGQSSGFVTPLITSAFTSYNPYDPAGWNNLFYTGTALLIVPYIVFFFFARFEPVQISDTPNVPSRNNNDKDTTNIDTRSLPDYGSISEQHV